MAVNATLSAAGDSAGRYTATCTGARDIAGNIALAVTIRYTVAPTTDSLIGLVQAYLPPNVNGLRDDLTRDAPSTLLGVAVLGYDDQLVEVEAIAITPERTSSRTSASAAGR